MRNHIKGTNIVLYTPIKYLVKVHSMVCILSLINAIKVFHRIILVLQIKNRFTLRKLKPKRGNMLMQLCRIPIFLYLIEEHWFHKFAYLKYGKIMQILISSYWSEYHANITFGIIACHFELFNVAEILFVWQSESWLMPLWNQRPSPVLRPLKNSWWAPGTSN